MAKILVVDDSKSMRDLLTHILVANNHEVIVASDGKEAHELAQTMAFNIALIDYNMPNMNGIKLIGKLREMDAYKFTPLVMVTTETDEYRKKKARAAGATGWLSKPFTDERIMAAVNKLLV